VIGLCGAMMLLEIAGGIAFGSLALIADGLHMSTHAGALLLAALAYTFARRYANDPRFSFGTGKLGDLAGFTSAVVLAMIALLIGYEAVARFLAPVPIHFAEAIPIAVLGLAVNVASAWLLGGGEHGHSHGHGHAHAPGGDDGEVQRFALGGRRLSLEIFETAAPPRFRLRVLDGEALASDLVEIETTRPGGARQRFAMAERGAILESLDVIPEPHDFTARVSIGSAAAPASCDLIFEEAAGHGHDGDHGRGAHHRDNNMRAAIVHVMADAAVSVLVIIGLVLARTFGWLWMDPLAGLIGAGVIASWSYGLIRDTGAILLDMSPNARLEADIRRVIEDDGDAVTDLHLWRLGPGHLGAIVCVATPSPREAGFYRSQLLGLGALSHLTVEVARSAA
jgi:cation diffusion facilitator family transporter